MADFAEGLRLLAATKESHEGVSVYTRFINRPVGRIFAAMAYRIGLTPNHVTLVSAVFTYFGIAVVATQRPEPRMALVACAALVVGFALDAADGQLARTQNSSSAKGEWLDHVFDCGKITAIHMAVLVSFYRFFDLPSPAYLLVPIAFQFAAVVIYFAGILTGQLKRKAESAVVVTTPSALRAVLLLPVDYGLFCVTFAALGNPELFLRLYTVLLVANFLFMFAFLVKWFRELP